MRKLGYILLIGGFVWEALFLVENIDPIPRAVVGNYIQSHKIQEHQTYSGKDVIDACREIAWPVARCSEPSFCGALAMFVGGILLARNRRQDSTADKPPII
jgi:hypothetical protein